MRRLDLKEEEFKSLKEYIALTKAVYKDAYFDNKVSFGNYKKISDLLVKLESLKKHRVRYDKTKTKRYMEENAIYAASSKLSCSKGVLFLRKVDGEFGFLFNQFKVAFIKENILEDYLYYSDNTYFYNTSKYLINITWIFED